MNDLTKEELLTIRHGLCKLIANEQWESMKSNHILILHKKINDMINELEDE